jgi:hypothetical protein
MPVSASNLEVVGSSPTPATKYPEARLVELIDAVEDQHLLWRLRLVSADDLFPKCLPIVVFELLEFLQALVEIHPQMSDDVANIVRMADVLARLPDHPANQVAELLPWTWKATQQSKTAAAVKKTLPVSAMGRGLGRMRTDRERTPQ